MMDIATKKSLVGYGISDSKLQQLTRVLGTKDYMVIPLPLYNTLGIGLTQYAMASIVLTDRPIKNFILGNTYFYFVKKSTVPKTLSKELLMVTFFDASPHIPDNIPKALKLLCKKVQDTNQLALKTALDLYGSSAARAHLGKLI